MTEVAVKEGREVKELVNGHRVTVVTLCDICDKCTKKETHVDARTIVTCVVTLCDTRDKRDKRDYSQEKENHLAQQGTFPGEKQVTIKQG